MSQSQYRLIPHCRIST